MKETFPLLSMYRNTIENIYNAVLRYRRYYMPSQRTYIELTIIARSLREARTRFDNEITKNNMEFNWEDGTIQGPFI